MKKKILITENQFKKLLNKGSKRYLNESENVSQMSKPSGDKLEFPECPEGQYWDFTKKKCVDYGFSKYDTPKVYTDTYSGMDDYFAKQKELFYKQLNDTREKDKKVIEPYFKRAKDYWRNRLNDPITRSKHKEQFNLTDEQVENKFKNYLTVIDNTKLEMINRYGSSKGTYAFISDAYIDSDLNKSGMGTIFQTEYDSLISAGSNEVAAWLGSLVSTISGGNDINDCRVFIPSPLIGVLAYYEQTFVHEMTHLLDSRVGPLTSSEVLGKSFPKTVDKEGISVEDIKKSNKVLANYSVYVPDESDMELDIPKDLKLDLNKGISDFMKLSTSSTKKNLSAARAKTMIKKLLNVMEADNNKSYDCDYMEKTANVTEIRSSLNLSPGEKLEWAGVVLSYFNDGWVVTSNKKQHKKIETLPVYRILSCWIWNNFTPDLQTLFENIDNFVMSKEEKGIKTTSPLNDKNLELAHYIRKNIKDYIFERNDTQLPFEENKVNGFFIRTFSNDVEDTELVWHRDKEDRVVESVGHTDWMIQIDNELPKPLTERTFIPKEKYHRVIKGSGDLVVRVKKL